MTKHICYYDHEGNGYTSQSAMCKAFDISLTAYRKRRQRGWSLEQALTTPKQEIPEKFRYKDRSYRYQFAGGTVTVREHLRN